ncbi:hypothetical protein [Marinicrinis sediminis]|uniref:Uncharacterized protein n=1 Tax=Marinicrinis sediminis TaxID=1652465 RepID=A0ABW5RAK0_9BACL
MKKTIFVFSMAAIVMLSSLTALAYNYKFSFDMNTGLFHGAVYTDYAYKYTNDEAAVIDVDHVESSVRANFMVVNSGGDQRSDIFTTRNGGTHVFETGYGMAQNHQYRVKAWTNDGSWYNKYNVTGAWNPDSY